MTDIETDASFFTEQVRKHWSQLAEDRREQLYRFLSEIILTVGFPKAPVPHVLKVIGPNLMRCIESPAVTIEMMKI